MGEEQETDVDREELIEDKAMEQIKEEKEKRHEVGDPEKMPPVEES